MFIEKAAEPIRVNARNTDIFDLFNLREYLGANPYLNSAALVFDLALTGYARPREIEDYLEIIGERYPRLTEIEYASHAELDMDLHLQGWSVTEQKENDFMRIAIESLHLRTTREVIYSVWDWFEAIQRSARANAHQSSYDTRAKLSALEEGKPFSEGLRSSHGAYKPQGKAQNCPSDNLWRVAPRNRIRGTAPYFKKRFPQVDDFSGKKKSWSKDKSEITPS
jgi:hypothetical protein